MAFDKGLLQRTQRITEYTGKTTEQTAQHFDDTWRMYHSYQLHALPQTWNKHHVDFTNVELILFLYLNLPTVKQKNTPGNSERNESIKSGGLTPLFIAVLYNSLLITSGRKKERLIAGYPSYGSIRPQTSRIHKRSVFKCILMLCLAGWDSVHDCDV